jgi:hypothetical protein
MSDGLTLSFSDDVWNLLVTYGRLPADAPGLAAPGFVRVSWDVLEPSERAQLYRSLVRCASRAGSRQQRVEVASQLSKLAGRVAGGSAGSAPTDAASTSDSLDADSMS